MGARFSAPVQTGPGAHPAYCTMRTGSFPGGKERPGRDADPSPPSSAVGHEIVELYLYFPYGPYGLYRASVPVQGCTLPFYSLFNVIARRGGWLTPRHPAPQQLYHWERDPLPMVYEDGLAPDSDRRGKSHQHWDSIFRSSSP